ENEPGRATKGAAQALKARVLLYESRWSEAAATAKKVMDSGAYSLFPEYRGLFKLENEGNSEVIWDIQCLQPRFCHGLDNVVTFHVHGEPTKGLVDANDMPDGQTITVTELYNSSNKYEKRDSRSNQTIRSLGYIYNDDIDTREEMYQTGFGTKK